MNLPTELQKWVDDGTLEPDGAFDDQLLFVIDAAHGRGHVYSVTCYDDGMVVIDREDREHGPQDVFDGDADSADCWINELISGREDER